VSKKNQNIFRESAEALTAIREELETLNSLLYGLGVELADLNSKVESLEEFVRATANNPLRVVVDTESLLAAIKKAERTTKPEAAKVSKVEFKGE